MEDYTSLLPLLPPEGILEWAQSQGQLNGHIIAYEKVWLKDPLTELKHTACRCQCSACREVFYLNYRAGGVGPGYPNNTYSCYNPETNETFGDWSSTLCPECKTPVRTLRLAFIQGYHYSGSIRPITIHVIDKDKLAIIEWQITRLIYRDMRIEIKYNRREAYILDGKKLIRFRGYDTGMFGNFDWLDDWQQLKRADDCSGTKEATDVYGFDIKQLQGTLWENSKLDKYLKANKHHARIVLYLRSFAQYPNIENIVMSPGAYLLTELYKKHTRGYVLNPAPRSITEINYKVARPAQMFGLNKDEFKFFTENKVEWAEIEFYKAHKDELKPEDMLVLKKLNQYKSLVNVEYPCNLMTAARYLLKQLKKRRDYYTTSVSYLHDYWRMLLQVDGAITANNRYPQNLHRAHDAVSARIEQAKKAEREEKFICRCRELAKFSWENEGIAIRAVNGDDELYAEGKKLCHCVYSYADRHCSGSTAIMVIRRVNEPEVPYYTLEFDEKNIRVRQNRGLRNCARTEEVERFEAAWLEHIKEIISKEKKNGKRNSKSRDAERIGA
jgi:hypothetical protein